MSPTLLLSAAAWAPSFLLLLFVARRDPKRLRAQQRWQNTPTRALSPASRRLGALLATMPAVVLLGLGQWPALLIWLASLGLSGWLLAVLLAPRPRPARGG